MRNNSRQYWLAEEAKNVAAKLDDYHHGWSAWSHNPIATAWTRNILAYYSTVLDAEFFDTSLRFEGEQGELVKMVIPQARSLLRQLVSILTKQRLDFRAIANNSMGDVVSAMRIANALCDRIVDDQHLDEQFELTVERALVVGSSFMMATWRSDRGKPWVVNPDGKVEYQGDLEICTPSVFDVLYDSSIMHWRDLDWAEVRRKMNRWDLIASFPQLEEKIINLPSCNEWRAHHGGFRNITEDDYINVYELYHKPTPALPQGRMMMYGSPDCIFADDDNLYGAIPIEIMKPENIEESGFGYPFFSNLLPAQEMLDTVFSSIATNQAAFAVQNVAVPRGSNISVQEISGMNWISYDPQNVKDGGLPTPLQLTKSPAEAFKFIDLLQAHQQQISNINSALRGSPPPGVTSGTAIATLSTNALEFIDAAAKSGAKCLERVMAHAINAYKRFANTEYLIEVAGPNQKSKVMRFTGATLKPIKQIKITRVNPLMQTLAGRTDLAEKMVQSGLVKNVQGYVKVLEGEPLRALYTTELSEEDLINSENERLLEGAPAAEVPSFWTDDHAKHIREHLALVNDPEVRMNSDMLKNVVEHINGHQKLAEGITSNPQMQFMYAMARTGQMPQGGMPQPQAPQGELPGGPPPAEGMEGPGMNEGQPTSQAAKPAESLIGRG